MLFLAIVAPSYVLGQAAPPPTLMIIDVDQGLFYARDTPDWTKYATERGPVREVQGVRNFWAWEGIGDIVAVGGRRMRGTWHSRAVQINMSPNPAGGAAIADVSRGGTLEWIMEILDLEGNRIGSIMGYGWQGGAAPAGGERMEGLELAITGGTGAYVGIRGQMASNRERTGAPAYRGNASMVEDPAHRRDNGAGQTRRHVLQVWPPAQATIERVLHGDFSPVTAASPARPGETLILMCANLGPVRPNVPFGQAFPEAPYAEVNAPVDVVVNGESYGAINKLGVPGQTNLYRVDIALPATIAVGEATIEVRPAFLNGQSMRIPVAAAR